MNIELRARTEIARPVAEVFAFAVDHRNLVRYLRAFGPIPGVVSARMDGEMREGAVRHVEMSDGSTMGEEIVGFEPNARHEYRWANPPKFPFSLMVRGALSSWRFSSTGSGTAIDWTYQMELTTLVLYPLAKPVSMLFQRWMQRGLDRLRTAMG